MQTFAVYVDDLPGALNRVVSLMRRLGLNIRSLTAAQSERPGVSRLTVVVETDARGARVIETNLRKIGMVRDALNLTSEPMLARDLAIIKLSPGTEARVRLMRLLEEHGARVVDDGQDTIAVEGCGLVENVDRLIDLLGPFGIVELARAGTVATSRGRVLVSRAT